MAAATLTVLQDGVLILRGAFIGGIAIISSTKPAMVAGPTTIAHGRYL